jgi:hypothetical protein
MNTVLDLMFFGLIGFVIVTVFGFFRILFKSTKQEKSVN